MRSGSLAIRAAALLVSTSLMAACWPFNSLDDCEQNFALTCYWDRLGSATGGGGAGGDGGPSPDCVPNKNADPVRDVCGVFVSIAGDDSADGTQKAPVKSLAKAIELAVDAGKPVYACAEEFDAVVEVPAGVTIFGGLDCADGWAYVGETTKTTIAGGPDEIALVLLGGKETTRLEDVRVVAADATVAGGSSIAALADGVTVELARCDLVAGAGMAGENGETPSESVGPADPNDPAIKGTAGAAACMGMGGSNPGGPGTLNAICDTSLGGDGGKGLESFGDAGGNGQPLPNPNPTNKGLGGAGDTGSGCEPGAQGANGTTGMAGAGVMELGTIDATGYAAPAGGNGSPGSPAQGGGGGGGAKGKLNCNGASGGGGGAGGCGGAGGTGGKAGGSSIALISLNATLRYNDVVLRTADGGKGGDGGDGQVGGAGGAGGPGGLGMNTLNACDGGKGGQGGFGGKGGGGRGGHSIGIAYVGAEPLTDGATIEIGAAGPGGTGADGTGQGADGVRATAQEFP
ncbi:MAG TPA: PGRS family protein [Polyangiaceae bacterium]|nr:PGRS family protein [Polyangiaceae bacterium]